MANLSELWEAAHFSLEQGEYEQAIATLSEIQSLKGIMRPQQLIELKQCFIEAYFLSGQTAEAKILCLSLMNNTRKDIRIWAEEKLGEIEPQEVTERTTDSSHQTNNQDGERFEPLLKSIPEFKQFCLDNIMDILKAFEQRRKSTIVTIAISTVVFVVVIFAIAQGTNFLKCIPNCSDLGITSSDHFSLRRGYSNTCHRLTQYRLSIFCVIALSFLFSTVGWIAFIERSIILYARGFQQRVIEKILQFIDPDRCLNYIGKESFNYLLNADLPLVNISAVNSQLFNSTYGIPDHIQTLDCIQGKINQTKIFWSHICVQKTSGYDLFKVLGSLDGLIWRLGIDNPWINLLLRIVLFFFKLAFILLIPIILIIAPRHAGLFSYLQSNLSWGRKTIFTGLFLEANFPKQLEQETFLYIANKNFKTQAKQVTQNKHNIVNLEDPKFNRLFIVRSNNQIAARYILSTNLMTRLTDFYEKVKRPIEISFQRDKIYIAIPYEHHVFEPRLFKSMLTFAPLKEYFITLSFILSVVRDLNLNRKIWG